MSRDGPSISASTAQVIADHSIDVIVRIGVDGLVSYISPSVRRYGYEPDAMIGRDGLDLVHPEDRARFAANAAALARGEVDGSVSRQHRIIKACGEVAWVEGNPQVVRGPSGQPIEFINIFRDVTARRAVEEQVREQAELFEAAFKYAAIGKALVGLDGSFLRINDAFCEVTGYREAELLALDFQTITHPDDLGLDLEQLGRLNRGEIDSYRMDKRYIRKDGTLIWVHLTVSMVRSAQGSPKHYVAQVQDLSERKAAEDALKQSEARYRVIADNTSDMIVISKMSGEVTYLSPSARHTGWAREELLGRNFGERMHPDDAKAVSRAFAKLLKGEDPGRVRWRGRNGKTGLWLWMESRPAVLPGPDGTPAGFIDVVRDITEQVRQEEALAAVRMEAEAAAAAKAQFLANMSHEIRTPLTAVLGFTSLLREHPTIDSVAAGYVARITAAGNGLLALVNDVLDFSKLEAGEIAIERRATSVRELVEGVAQIFEAQARDKGLKVATSITADMPATVRADANRLRQILLNLAGNAVKFTQAGQVSLEASWREPGFVRFVVRDSGPGISPEGQARLFQRFSQVDGSTTRTHGGTGLGLAICKGLVEAMGGEIGLDSVEGQGSAFYFDVPAQPLAAVTDESLAMGGDLPLAGSRVLIVDDNDVNRELVMALLSAYDLELIAADSGAGAVAACASHIFDMVLMDIRMPGMDGGEAMRLIREAPGPNVETPMVAFTADADRDSVDALLAAGFDGHLAKPIDATALIDCVARWTGDDPWGVRGGVLGVQHYA